MMRQIRRELTSYNMYAEGHQENTFPARDAFDNCLVLMQDKVIERIRWTETFPETIRVSPEEVAWDTCCWLMKRISEGRCVYLTQAYIDLRLLGFVKQFVHSEQNQRGENTESFDQLSEHNDGRLAKKTLVGPIADEEAPLDLFEAAMELLPFGSGKGFTVNRADVFCAWRNFLLTTGSVKGFSSLHRHLFNSPRQPKQSEALTGLLVEVYDCLCRTLPMLSERIPVEKTGNVKVAIKRRIIQIVQKCAGVEAEHRKSHTATEACVGSPEWSSPLRRVTNLLDFDYPALVRAHPRLMRIVRLHHLGKTRKEILEAVYGMPGDLDRDERFAEDIDAIVELVRNRIRPKEKYIVGGVRVARRYGLLRRGPGSVR